MSMTMLIAILVLLAAVLLLLRMRKRAGDAAKQVTSKTRRRKDTTYHAVSIRFESSACAAARDMSGRRFLATAAPRLPLPGCDVLECKCRFVHHDDRRTGRDRRNPFGPAGRLGATGQFEQEQRSGRDRRNTDFNL